MDGHPGKMKAQGHVKNKEYCRGHGCCDDRAPDDLDNGVGIVKVMGPSGAVYHGPCENLGYIIQKWVVQA